MAKWTSAGADETSASAHMATTTLRVGGMTCGACTSAVESGVKELAGVGNVTVSLVTERCVVSHDPKTTNAEQIHEAIEDRGFEAEILSSDIPLPAVDDFEDPLADDDLLDTISELRITTFSVGGMTCGACTSAVEGAFKDVSGINSFSISLLSERAVIEHDPKIIDAEKIAETIEDTGFEASIVDSKSATHRTHVPKRLDKGSVETRSTTTTVAIEGMTCGACTSAVEGGFAGVEGVFQFNISLLAERCVVLHDSDKLSTDIIIEIIEDRGFDAKIISSVDSDAQSTSASTVQLKIYGLPDVKACQALESTLRSMSGVHQARINFSTTRADIIFSASQIGIRALVGAVEAAGYNALLAEADDNNAQLESLAKTKEIHIWRRDFYVSLSFAIPVFLTSMIFPMLLPFLDYGSIKLPLIPGLWLGDVACLCLTIPVQFGIGRRFYISAFKSLKHRSPTMDVLVVLGTSAAFFFSCAAMLVSILTPPHSRPSTVFDTSTMLITFITFGRYLENRAKGQTSRALSRLMSLAPSMATIFVDPIAAEKLAEDSLNEKLSIPNEKISLNGDNATGGLNANQEQIVATELIQVGDVVILRPGDKIPADGTVIRGESYVDESMVTGEAMPIYKKHSSLLIAGTVNGAARLDFKVTRAGRDTQLSQIVRLVQEAQTSRAPIQRMADIVAGYFVPIIISLGVITFVAWMVLSHVLPHPPPIFMNDASGGWIMVCMKLCISVIVFACPCALGLSTPTAVMVGTGVGAEQGILVKGGAALETATQITHMIFDKTGTLTTGKMSVAKVNILQKPDHDYAEWVKTWWIVIGLAEMSSEHPIGKTIVLAAKEALNIGVDGSFDGSVDKFTVSVGQGISATITAVHNSFRSTHTILIGNEAFLTTSGISIPAFLDPVNTATTAGTTTIYTALDSTFAGTLSLSDTLKPSAAATITALNLMHIPSSIVTGDAASTAQHIASQLGIPPTNVHASCSPSRKQALIRELQAKGHIIGMVGDGINDSPALATSNVGISFSSGTDVAMEAADIVLMRDDDLLLVAASLHLAKTIFARIKLNLAWACGYNVLGLPFAMGVFLPWGYSLHPMAAGAAMACSSVSVVGSSLLLKLWRRPRWMEVEWLEREGTRPRGRWTRFKTSVRMRLSGLVGGIRGARRDDVQYVPLSTVEERV